MKKKLLIIILLIILSPIYTLAISNNYQDKTALITNTQIEDNKINLYLFYGEECPHCEKERIWLNEIKDDYKDTLNIYYFEVWHNKDNLLLAEKIMEEYEIKKLSVPLTIVGEKYFIGYDDDGVISSRIENQINEYLEIEGNSNIINLPILGNVDMRKVSLPLVAIILGFIDGFNPCAMWILLFLINMLFGVEKKKSWILGLTFLFISSLVYFLSMIGINFILSITTINYLKIIIAIFILIAGILNLRKYFIKRKEEAGCDIVDAKKRKKIITRMKQIINSKSFMFSLFGIIILSASVNLIELACSLGFPLIFTEILSINHIEGITKIIYLLIYILFYMIDDIVVFVISMVTLEATGITNKYNKLCTLISGIIMIIMGLLLIFKPDWLMLNF